MTRQQVTALGRRARWLLLLSTVFGLAMMHTLGHAGMHPPARHAGMPTTATGMPPTAIGMAATVAVMAEAPGSAVDELAGAVVASRCAGASCQGHGAGAGWSVCLAVLGGLALVVLLAVALRGRGGVAPGLRAAAATAGSPRSPPVIPTGLTLRSTAVLRI